MLVCPAAGISRLLLGDLKKEFSTEFGSVGGPSR
jgi:hypothetical protein